MNGRIPAGILRMKDYNCFMLGDRLFVSMMDACILYILVRGWPLSVNAVAISASAVVVWTAIRHDIWMEPRHRPDSFYPRAGVVSALGKIHLVYFAGQYMLGAMGLWMIGYMMAGLRPWSWVAAVAVASAMAYFVTLASDLAQGKFKRLPNQRG